MSHKTCTVSGDYSINTTGVITGATESFAYPILFLKLLEPQDFFPRTNIELICMRLRIKVLKPDKIMDILFGIECTYK